AGRYLHAHGGPQNMTRDIYAYNPSCLYVRAVQLYAKQMFDDPHAFVGYFNWQVYVQTTKGEVLLPEGFTGETRSAGRREHPREKPKGSRQRIVDRGLVGRRAVAKKAVRRIGIGHEFFVGIERVPKRRDLIRGDARIGAAEDAKKRNLDFAREL